jgi:hypothetical protein
LFSRGGAVFAFCGNSDVENKKKIEESRSFFLPKELFHSIFCSKRTKEQKKQQGRKTRRENCKRSNEQDCPYARLL